MGFKNKGDFNVVYGGEKLIHPPANGSSGKENADEETKPISNSQPEGGSCDTRRRKKKIRVATTEKRAPLAETNRGHSEERFELVSLSRKTLRP